MYVPLDLTRPNIKPIAFGHILATNIYPVHATDHNAIFRLSEEDYSFNYLDSTYRGDIGIRISRTPLSPQDPSTYAALSKYTEYYLRRLHSSIGALPANQLEKAPLKVPKDLVVSHSDGKTELLMIGSMINPLSSDKFKPVHLTPGCHSLIVTYEREQHNNQTNTLNKLFGKTGKHEKHSYHHVDQSDLKLPKSNLNRNTSTFVERITTCDNYIKKLNNARSILISAHGRVFSVLALDDDPKQIDIDPVCLRVTVSTSVITSMSAFKQYRLNSDKSLDVLFGFASGDILWLNPLKMKYSRWNKKGSFKKEIITSIEWSTCGNYGYVGFADGDLLIFNRDYEDNDLVYAPKVHSRKKNLKIYHSLNTSPCNHLVGHYKLAKKPITSIKSHPTYNNIIVITSDDGFTRVFDLLTESITDIVPSYYGGVLTSEFSPDGKYLFLGGEDDIGSVYSFQSMHIFGMSNERGLLRLVSRLQGAKSWVRGIVVRQQAFSSSLSYTVGAASDDGYIRFYEFQPRSARKAKKHHTVMTNHMGTPKSPAQKALSALSIERSGSLESRHRKLTPRASTNHSLSPAPNRLSLRELINSGASSTSLVRSQNHSSKQMKLGDGVLMCPVQINDKANDSLVSHHVMFKEKKLNHNILFSEVRDTYIHNTVGMESVTKTLPVSEKNVNLGRLSGLYIEDHYIWAFVAGGDLIRFKKYSS